MDAIEPTRSPRATGTPRSWSPGPGDPRLEEGTAHIWRADLRAVNDELGLLLGEQESARAERLLSDAARLRWTRCRGVLRALLGRYAGLDPRALEFSLGEHGKPMLDTPAAEPIQFNLSHSGDLALYAVSGAAAVGIDVETSRRHVDELGIAARVLGDAAAERLRALDPEARTREFLRAWVAHEAAVKCRGSGIGRGSGEPAAAGLWTAELDVGPGAAAAVAVDDVSTELRLWEWWG
jgi:4'-phosphopantetheinyl transferase